MAGFRALAIVIGVVAVFVSSTMATEYVVGDDKGWRQNNDYEAWVQGKQFFVGDTVVFKYTEGVHNVRKVNGTAFQQCVAPLDAESLTSGNDVVQLAKPGPKWYICSKANHCAAGNMKLKINVLTQVGSPGSAPYASPPGTAVPVSAGIMRASSVTTTTAWIVVILGIVMAKGLC